MAAVQAAGRVTLRARRCARSPHHLNDLTTMPETRVIELDRTAIELRVEALSRILADSVASGAAVGLRPGFCHMLE